MVVFLAGTRLAGVSLEGSTGRRRGHTDFGRPQVFYQFHAREKGIFFIAASGGPNARAAIEFFDFATAKRTGVRSLQRQFTCGIALSPDQRSPVHGLMDNASSNLMLVENYR